MDCLLNFCGLVVGLVGFGVFTHCKNKTRIKICRNKKPFSNSLFSLNKHDSNELNFVYPIRVIMRQHCMNSDTKGMFGLGEKHAFPCNFCS